MNNYIITSFLITMIAFNFQSCEDDTVNPEKSSQSFITAVINDDDELIELVGEPSAYAIDLSNSFNVYGIIDHHAQKSIYIQLPLNPTNGTYEFDDQVFAYVVDGEKSWSTLVGKGNGSVTIESSDGIRYKGTFSFTAYDFEYSNLNREIWVHNGRFDLLKR